MALSVVMAFPLNIHPCRYTLDTLFFQQYGAKRSVVRHTAWTLAIASAGLLIALYVPGINVVFQLMGSTSSAFVCFVLPAAFGLRLRLPEARGALGTAACWAMVVGGVAIGAVATSNTIGSLIHGRAEDEARVESAHVIACRRQCVVGL